MVYALLLFSLSVVLAAGAGGGGGGSSGSSSGSRSGASSGSASAPKAPNIDPDPDPTTPDAAPDSSNSGTGNQSSASGGTIPNQSPAPENPIEDIGQQVQAFLDAITSVTTDVVSGSSTITSVATLPTAAYPCVTIRSLYASCSAATSNFGAEAQSVQASCLCYGQDVRTETSTWAPASFDSLISSCDRFVKAQTQFFGVASNIEGAIGLCTIAENVRASSGASVHPTGTSAMASVAYSAAVTIAYATADASNTLSSLPLSIASQLDTWRPLLLFGMIFIASAVI